MFDRVGLLRDDDEVGPEPTNYYREAFLLPQNWIPLAGAAAFSLLLLNPFPLLAAIGLELMYLSLVPSNPRFQRWVRAHRQVRQQRESERKLAATLKALPPLVRKKCFELNRICQNIRENYGRLSSPSRLFLEQLEQSLVSLVHASIRLLSASHQYGSYLQDVDPQKTKRELEKLQTNLTEENTEIRGINQQRIAILTQRLAKFDKIRDNARILEAQCGAIEDVLKLIHEQSLTLRDPAQIACELQSLVEDVRRTEETVREVEETFKTEVGILSPVSLTRSSRSGGDDQ